MKADHDIPGEKIFRLDEIKSIIWRSKVTFCFILGFLSVSPWYSKAESVSVPELFSQDFTWSYYLKDSFYSAAWWNLRFGEPMMRNGVEYRPFEFSGSLHTFGDELAHPFSPYNAANEFPPCLIREDNGKVFGIVPIQYLSEMAWWESGYDDTKEYMLYDFSAEVGDTYQTLSNFGEVISVEVEAVNEIEINGKRRKIQTVKYPEPFDSEKFQVIENIGIVNGGFFPYLNVHLYTGKPPRNAPGAGNQVRIKYILDCEGNVIYGSPFVSEVLTISEGRRWEYVSRQPAESGYKYTLDSYSFENIHPYKLYRVGDWYHLSSSEWEVKTTNGVETVTRGATTDLNEYVVTMAESYDRVYVVERDFDVAGNRLSEQQDCSECVLYDYSYRLQPDVAVALTGWYPEDSEMKKLNPYALEVELSNRTAYWFENLGWGDEISVHPYMATTDLPVENNQSGVTEILRYISGVGNVGLGDMLSLEFTERENESSTSDVYGKSFNRLLDENGNVLYAGKNVDLPSFVGVNEITDVVTSTSGIFDLFGREVTDPQPGTVYIRDGKKFVAR